MHFDRTMLKGARLDSGRGGQVDYRLVRDSVIRNYRNGRLSVLDVCDAHPELLRAAKGVGDATSELCPICEDAKVVLVTYVFGNGLGPSGHNVTSRIEVEKLAKRSPELTCYVVEVCPACKWNHLAKSIQMAGHGRRSVPAS